MTHNQRIRLADEIGLTTRGKLNRGNQRPAGGNDPLFAGAGNIGISTDESGSAENATYGGFDFVVGIISCFTENDVIGIFAVELHTPILQSLQQTIFTNRINFGTRGLILQKTGGGDGAGHKVVRPDRDTHGGQTVRKLLRGPLGTVGQK